MQSPAFKTFFTNCIAEAKDETKEYLQKLKKDCNTDSKKEIFDCLYSTKALDKYIETINQRLSLVKEMGSGHKNTPINEKREYKHEYGDETEYNNNPTLVVKNPVIPYENVAQQFNQQRLTNKYLNKWQKNIQERRKVHPPIANSHI